MFPDVFTDEVFRLETARLWLRWPRMEDVRDIERFSGLEQVATHTATWPHPLPAGYVADRIASARAGNTAGSLLVLAIATRKDPRRAIGLIGGAAHQGDARAPALGYMLAPEHWGKGLMTEALAALVDAMFWNSDIDAARAAAFPVNVASQRVLAKCGFAHTGRFAEDMPQRGGLCAVDRFQLTRAAWREAWGRRWLRPEHAVTAPDRGCTRQLVA